RVRVPLIAEEKVARGRCVAVKALLNIDTGGAVEREIVVVEVRQGVASAGAAAEGAGAGASGGGRRIGCQKVGGGAGRSNVVVSGDDVQRNAAQERRTTLIGIDVAVPVGEPHVGIVTISAVIVDVIAGIQRQIRTR